MNQEILILILVVGFVVYLAISVYIVNKIVFLEIDNDKLQEKNNKEIDRLHK